MSVLRQSILVLRQGSRDLLVVSNWTGIRYPSVAGEDLIHEIYLTSLGRAVSPPASVYPAKGHPEEFQFTWEKGRRLGDFALLWIERGRGCVETAELGTVPLRPGHILLLAPGEWHRYRPDPECGWVERWICANGTYLHRMRKNGVFPSTSELRPLKAGALLEVSFDQLRHQSDENCLWVSGLTLSLLAAALGETERKSAKVTQASTSGDVLVDAIVHYIGLNCHRSLNVLSIAQHFGLSRRMLERRFAQAGHRPVALELTHARLYRAIALLSQREMTVKEAGYAAGFGGAPRFIAAHHRIFGNTPGRSRIFCEAKN